MIAYPLMHKPDNITYNDFLMHTQYIGDIKKGIRNATANVVTGQAVSTKILQDTFNKNSEFIIQTLTSGFHEIGSSLSDINNNLTNLDNSIQSGFEQTSSNIMELNNNLIDGFEQTSSNLLLLNDSLVDGFEQISSNIMELHSNLVNGFHEVSSEIQGLRSDFNIAMGAVALQLEMQRNEMRQGFQSIIHILENKRKTEAMEHFEDAIGFYNDGCKFIDKPVWFQNAHRHFQASIQKYERNPLAHLHLAHIYHYQEAFRDFEKALEHYELCYTYGEADEKSNAVTAQGYFYAGWLRASVFDDIDNAIKLTKEAIHYDPSLDKAYYHLSKFYAVKKDAKNALHYLKKIIVDFDRNYTLKAKLDPNFENIKKSLDLFLEELKTESFQKLTTNFNALQKKIARFEIAKEDIAKEDYDKLQSLCDTIKLKPTNTYFDNLNYLYQLQKCKVALFNSLNLKERDRLKEEILAFIYSVNYTYDDIFKEFIVFKKRVEEEFKTAQTYKEVVALYEIFLWLTVKHKTEMEHSGYVESVAFSPDGAFIASGSFDEIRLWNVKSGEEIGEISRLEQLQLLEQERKEKERKEKAKLEQQEKWRQNKQCELCGAKLGFFEKLSGETQCKNCQN